MAKEKNESENDALQDRLASRRNAGRLRGEASRLAWVREESMTEQEWLASSDPAADCAETLDFTGNF